MGNRMLNILFESRSRAHRDIVEMQNLQTTYGRDFIAELKQRAQDMSLGVRDRKHWKRLLRKARKADV